MILIGQYDSPFVRRVAIALDLYGIAYEHRPWAVFGEPEKIAPYNPLLRVPALVLGNGETLIESGAILDYLDEVAGSGRALIPRTGEARRHALKTISLAAGLGEKAVSLVYERVLRIAQSDMWVERCRTQIGAGLDALETESATRTTPYWYGDAIGHADIAVACVLGFVREAHAAVFDPARWPRLAAHSDRCETLELFRNRRQAFYVAAPSR